MTATRHFLLAAGGTGGHMLPAYALAGELIARGHRVALVSDDRGLKIPGAPAEMETHVLPAGRVHGGPVGWLKAALAIRKGSSEEHTSELQSLMRISYAVFCLKKKNENDQH